MASSVRKLPMVAAIAWASGVAAVGAATAVRKLGDFDLPWHLAFGRIVAKTTSIPATDDLAYTGRPIEYAEFVADLLLYTTIHLAGPLGLQLLGGLLAAAVVAILSWGPNRGPVAGPIVASFAAAAASAWLIVRPATFSFVLLGLTLLAIETHRARSRSSRGRVALACLVPLNVLWANVHGFVVVGVVIVVTYALYRTLCTVAAGRRLALGRVREGGLPAPRGDLLPTADAGEVRWTAAAALCTVGGSMLNMAGPKLLLGPLRAVPDTDRVTEWAPTTLRFLVFQEPVAGAFALLVIAAMAFGRDPNSGRRLPTGWDIAMFALASILAASAVRLVAVGAILSAPVVARRLAPVVPITSITGIAAASSPLLLAAWMFMRGGTTWGVGFEPDHFPEPAVQYIQRHNPTGPMWNSLVYGGYLTWRLHPNHRVLMDGRTGWVHEPRVVTLAHQSERDPEAFGALVQEFGIQWAVCRAVEGESRGVPLAADQRWVMVFWDDVSAVYVRRDGANGALATSGYRMMRHLTPVHVALRFGANGQRTADLTHDADLAVAQAPDSPRAAFLEGCAAIGRRDAEGVTGAIRRVRASSPTPEPALALEQVWESVVR